MKSRTFEFRGFPGPVDLEDSVIYFFRKIQSTKTRLKRENSSVLRITCDSAIQLMTGRSVSLHSGSPFIVGTQTEELFEIEVPTPDQTLTT